MLPHSMLRAAAAAKAGVWRAEVDRAPSVSGMGCREIVEKPKKSHNKAGFAQRPQG